MKKKLLAMVMTLAMVLSLVPVTALAEEVAPAEEQQTANDVEVETLEDAEENVEEQSVETSSTPADTDIIQNDVKYMISSGEAIVIGCTEDATELVIPEKITVKDEEYPVTKVSRGLQNNSKLTRVEIQAPITDLENSLFLNDNNLASVKLPDTVKTIETAAFQNCSSLKQIDLPEGLEIIKNAVFMGTAIESITLPSTLKELQSSAFNSVTTLKTVDFNNAETSVGEKCFQGCNALETVSNTENITELGDYAFGSDYQGYNGVNVHCQSLAGEIKLNSVTKIGKAAFKNCTALNKVSGLENVTEIPDEVFNSCFMLSSVSGLNSVTVIGDSAFSNCITYMPINGKYVKTSGITELEGLQLSNLTSIGTSALDSVKAAFEIDEDTFTDLTFLGAGAFSNASNLTGKLILPEGIESVGKNTFRATGITEAVLPDSVRSIGTAAFFNCQKLTNVQVGQEGGQSSQLTRIEMGAFANDNSITSFVIEADKADISISTDKFKLGFNQFDVFPEEVVKCIHYTIKSIDSDDIGDGTDLQTAINSAADGGTVTAKESFLVKSTVTIPAGKTITLTGENITVQPDKNFSGPLFVVENEANLFLDGTLTYKCQNLSDGVFAQVKGKMTMNNGLITSLNTSERETGVIDVDGGSFTMQGGTISKVTGSGSSYGAVYVQNVGTFEMNGGKIVDCTMKNQFSGTVVLDQGTMTMDNGKIDGNTATDFNSAGGVLVNNASTFSMTGGTISNNTAKRGGGVLVRDKAKFIMSNGTISGNKARVESDTIKKPNAGGGGVFVEDDASFTMSGGTITENTTNGMGGGVATAVLNESDTTGGGKFSMIGGTISKNTASCGGGVYSWSGEGRVVLEGGNIVDNTATRQCGGDLGKH